MTLELSAAGKVKDHVLPLGSSGLTKLMLDTSKVYLATKLVSKALSLCLCFLSYPSFDSSAFFA